jgi:cell division protein FtsQ
MDTVNIFSLDLPSIAQELEKQPWIKNAVIKRNLPDNLEIHVEEYTPMALVGTDKLYLVDGDGIIFKGYEKDETEIMPVITGLSSNQIKDGKLPEYAEKAMFVIKFAKNGLRTLGINNIGRIHFDATGEMIVYTLNQGIAIKFGSLEKFKEKGVKKALIKSYNRAESILYQVFKSGRYKDVASIDLDYAGNMAVLSYKK